MKKFIKSNIKLVIAFALGLLIAGTIVYAVTGPSGSYVSYSNTSSKLTSTNVQGAIDEINEKAMTFIDPSAIDFKTVETLPGQVVLASSKGICAKIYNKVACFKPNNWNVEKEHIQQVYPDGRCQVYSDQVLCNGPDISCNVYSNGKVLCFDQSTTTSCSVSQSGNVDCDGGYGMIYSSYIDFGTIEMNSTGEILASKNGVCIEKNDKVHCFRINNYNAEKEHIQQVFRDGSCQVYSDQVLCKDFYNGCNVYEVGEVLCFNPYDPYDGESCSVSYRGEVNCS